MAAPPIIGVIALEDAEAFKRGMDGLAAWGAAAGAAVLTVEVDEYRGRPLYTLQFKEFAADSQSLQLPDIVIGMEGFMRPCLAILDDRVILTPLPNHTKRELRRALKDEDAGSEAFDLEGVPSGVSGAAVADWASFLGSVYGGLKALARTAVWGGGHCPNGPLLPKDRAQCEYSRASRVRAQGPDLGLLAWARGLGLALLSAWKYGRAGIGQRGWIHGDHHSQAARI